MRAHLGLEAEEGRRLPAALEEAAHVVRPRLVRQRVPAKADKFSVSEVDAAFVRVSCTHHALRTIGPSLARRNRLVLLVRNKPETPEKTRNTHDRMWFMQEPHVFPVSSRFVSIIMMSMSCVDHVSTPVSIPSVIGCLGKHGK